MPRMPLFSRSLAIAAITAFAFSPVLSQPANAENPEITVYNQNFALVKDYKDITLKDGVNTVYLDDVAALIDPTSVHFKSLTAPNDVTVLEQNFKYDLISKSNILDRMVGKTIRFMKDGKVEEGTLLNPVTSYIRYNNGGASQTTTSEFAVQTKDGILLTTLDDVIIDKLPDGLYPRPTLMWKLDTDKPGTHKTEVSYLTDNLTWDCDYVAVINDDDSKLDLTGWVTLDNKSGTTYDNARLKLVAGDVRKIQPPAQAYGGIMAKSMVTRDEAAPQFQEESFFEYHLYTLKNRTTVSNNETKQISLIDAKDIPISKQYIYDPDRQQYVSWLGGANDYYGTFDFVYNRPGQGSDTSDYHKINTLITLKNSKANHLGIPMPKGKIRVNKADSSGSLQFVGEDMIDHTPTDEDITLYLGDAFDLVGDKKMTTYHRDTDSIDETYEVTLKNHKKSENVTINAVEHTFGDWKIVNASDHWDKTDAHTISFPVRVPAGGEKTITYTIHIKRS